MNIFSAARCRVLLSLCTVLAAGAASPAGAQEVEARTTDGAALESTSADEVMPEPPAVAADEPAEPAEPAETPVTKRTDKQALRRDLTRNQDGSPVNAVHRLSEAERAALHRDLRSAIRTANVNDDAQLSPPSADKIQPVEYRHNENPGP
ncbi:hypothetical protein AGMMS49960_01450 [Betaproteobacteria bacterium]|nr:hypothetical protein AGMMS49543_12110 [Betaproteobacteria bacterium]GHT98424.1 hypothetical protein AGMMS49960_01450 [Betaproteobacteria bacterium]GHU16799.1 hypothetical protein AGMMS50243_03790 [Betaproteobacteria bacterium]GHV87625.1 hypothetical protein AGMMS50255_9210 [Spirochaetia bacterium]